MEPARRSNLSATPVALFLAILGALSGASMAATTLNPNERLLPGGYLSVNSYTFIMQTDCNLVLYDSGRAIWASGTYRKGSGCYLKMQRDGNLVIYDGGNRAVWSSGTYRAENYYFLVLQQDRNVVIYGPGGRAIWSTGTYIRGAKPVVIAKDDVAVPVVGGRKVNPAGAVAGVVAAAGAVPKVVDATHVAASSTQAEVGGGKATSAGDGSNN